MPRSKLQGYLGLVLSAALALAACGGSAHPAAGTSATTHTVTVVVTPKAHDLAVAVRAAGAKKFVPMISARPGDEIAFRAVLPAAAGTAPQNLVLSAQSGPGSKLVITGSAGAQTASAAITSATGSAITLTHLSYACDLPPHPTFCPATSITTGAGATRLQFSASHRTPVEVSAVVGPVTLPAPKTRPPGSSPAPPYTLTELLRARTPGAPTPPTAPKAQPTVTVQPGQVVSMYSHLRSHFRGTKQAVTVTIGSGPGNALTVTAGVPGGVTSTARIVSATGAPIRLVKARYTCLVAPLPTFCPATRVGATGGGYAITFLAAPGTPEIEISANVQAG